MTDTHQSLVRTFVAINPPDTIRTAFARVLARMRSVLPYPEAIKWVAPEQCHVTLRFIGEVPAEAVPDLVSGLRMAARTKGPLQLAAGGLGRFPAGARPKVLWIGIAGDVPALRELAEAVTVATAEFGRIEDRPFQAHLTLARIKTGDPRLLREIARRLENAQVDELGRWTVTGMDLMKSTLTPAGPIYECLASVPLGAAEH